MCAPAFPIADLLDEDLCYLWLMRARWPGAKPVCPKCGEVAGVYCHSVEPNGPVEDFHCKKCACVLNVYTDTIFSRTKRSFRGVSKKYLFGYVSAFEWIWNRKGLDKADLYSVLLHQVQGGLTYEPG